MKGDDTMKTMTVLEFLKEADLLDTIEKMGYLEIPLTVSGLMWLLDDAELNYWSYAEYDKDEIKNPEITVLVRDMFGDSRYYETAETITW